MFTPPPTIFSSFVFPLYTLRLVSSGGTAFSSLIAAGDLAVNLGLPTFFGFAGWSWSHLRQRAADRPDSFKPQPVPAMPIDTPPPEPTALATEFAAQPDSSDPTGQRRVDEELDGLHGLS